MSSTKKILLGAVILGIMIAPVQASWLTDLLDRSVPSIPNVIYRLPKEGVPYDGLPPSKALNLAIMLGKAEALKETQPIPPNIMRKLHGVANSYTTNASALETEAQNNADRIVNLLDSQNTTCEQWSCILKSMGMFQGDFGEHVLRQAKSGSVKG